MLHTLNALRAYEPDNELEPVWPKAVGVGNDKLRILLVEDVSSDAALARIALDATNIPFKLTKCKRGDEMLSTLDAIHQLHPSDMPDLILLDLGLPGMDGFEVLAELAHMPLAIRSIPIAVLTAHSHFEYISGSYPVYIMDYINKPCNVSQMRPLLLRVQTLRDRS